MIIPAVSCMAMVTLESHRLMTLHYNSTYVTYRNGRNCWNSFSHLRTRKLKMLSWLRITKSSCTR